MSCRDRIAAEYTEHGTIVYDNSHVVSHAALTHGEMILWGRWTAGKSYYCDLCDPLKLCLQSKRKMKKLLECGAFGTYLWKNGNAIGIPRLPSYSIKNTTENIFVTFKYHNIWDTISSFLDLSDLLVLRSSCVFMINFIPDTLKYSRCPRLHSFLTRGKRTKLYSKKDKTKAWYAASVASLHFSYVKSISVFFNVL